MLGLAFIAAVLPSAAGQDMLRSTCRLAPEVPMARGRPVRSVSKWTFDPNLPRSTGFGPVNSPFSEPACSLSRSRTVTSPAHHGSRVHRGPGGATWPTPGPWTTRRVGGGPSGRTGRTTRPVADVTYSPTSRQSRSPSVPHDRHADPGQHLAVASAPRAPHVGTTTTTRPAQEAPQSPQPQTTEPAK